MASSTVAHSAKRLSGKLNAAIFFLKENSGDSDLGHNAQSKNKP